MLCTYENFWATSFTLNLATNLLMLYFILNPHFDLISFFSLRVYYILTSDNFLGFAIFLQLFLAIVIYKRGYWLLYYWTLVYISYCLTWLLILLSCNSCFLLITTSSSTASHFTMVILAKSSMSTCFFMVYL